jgi:hypothetical protein
MLRLTRIAAAMLLAVPASALAADRSGDGMRLKYQGQLSNLAHTAGAYPVSRQVARIRHADRCWRACLVATGREFQACLRIEPLTDCVRWNGAADLACLHQCRHGGGPWVRIIE